MRRGSSSVVGAERETRRSSVLTGCRRGEDGGGERGVRARVGEMVMLPQLAVDVKVGRSRACMCIIPFQRFAPSGRRDSTGSQLRCSALLPLNKDTLRAVNGERSRALLVEVMWVWMWP